MNNVCNQQERYLQQEINRRNTLQHQITNLQQQLEQQHQQMMMPGNHRRLAYKYRARVKVRGRYGTVQGSGGVLILKQKPVFRYALGQRKYQSTRGAVILKQKPVFRYALGQRKYQISRMRYEVILFVYLIVTYCFIFARFETTLVTETFCIISRDC